MQQIQYISSLFGYDIGRTIAQPVVVDPTIGKNSIFNLFKKYLSQHPDFFKSTRPDHLQCIKIALLRSGIDKDHCDLKALDAAILKIQQAAGPIVQSRISPTRLGYPAAPSPYFLKEPSSTIFVQSPWMTVEETKNTLSNLKEPIEEMELHDLNDDLLAFVAEKFPKLTALRIHGGIASVYGPWDDFTDQGLVSIGTLSSLQKFEISDWGYMVSITTGGIKNLLSQPTFVNQLTELKLNTFQTVDETLLPIAMYKQLKTLALYTTWGTPAGLAAVLKSSSLKNTLSSFYCLNLFFNGDTSVTNVLKELESYPYLEHLFLDGRWNAEIASFQKVLAAQIRLKTLVLDAITINDDLAKEIGKMIGLEHLELFNCVDVTSDNGLPQLLQSKDRLQYLNLQEASHLRDEQFSLIGPLKALKFLSLSSSIEGLVTNDGLKLLCGCEAAQNNLQTLRLKGFQSIKSEGFAPLSQLQKLSNLRVDNCSWFNDTSLSALVNSPLKNTIQELEFNKTAIVDESILSLIQFENLKNLTLAKCYAFTDLGKKMFLDQRFFQEKLFGLCTDYFDLSDELVEKFSNFEALKILIISNNTISDKAQKLFHDLAKKNKWLSELSWGATGYFDTFERAIKEIQPEDNQG